MPQANAHPTPFDQDDVNETIPLIPEDILRQHHCLEPDASRFTAAARLLQSLWRQDQNLPVGRHRSPSGKHARSAPASPNRQAAPGPTSSIRPSPPGSS